LRQLAERLLMGQDAPDVRRVAITRHQRVPESAAEISPVMIAAVSIIKSSVRPTDSPRSNSLPAPRRNPFGPPTSSA